MYVDTDAAGRIAIMDLTPEELETVRCALLALKTGLLQSRLPDRHSPHSGMHDQYYRAGELLRQIENL